MNGKTIGLIVGGLALVFFMLVGSVAFYAMYYKPRAEVRDKVNSVAIINKKATTDLVKYSGDCTFAEFQERCNDYVKAVNKLNEDLVSFKPEIENEERDLLLAYLSKEKEIGKKSASSVDLYISWTVGMDNYREQENEFGGYGYLRGELNKLKKEVQESGDRTKDVVEAIYGLADELEVMSKDCPKKWGYVGMWVEGEDCPFWLIPSSTYEIYGVEKKAKATGYDG